MSVAFTPKFAIGQRVYSAEAVDEAVMATCPDCSGSKVWLATSPAGETFEFPCPRCQNHDVWKLRHNKAVATTRTLTIGSVRINTDEDEPVSYMCEETGVGSGTIWRQNLLAGSPEEAAILGRDAVATRELWRATELERRERNSGWGPGGMKHRLEVALRYQPWTTKEITEARSEGWEAGYRQENLCNAIAELDAYGGIEGLDTPTLDRIIAHLADCTPRVKECRDAVMHDRESARKAA